METKDCPMCQDRRNARWTEALARGNKTIKEAMTAFGMSRADVEEHLYKHAPQFEAPTDKDRTYDKEYYIRLLDQMGEDLRNMLEETLATGRVDSETIRSATTLTKEIRETLRLLGDITKVLRDDNTAELERNILEMRNNYLTLTNIITAKVCPECQKNIIEAIETQRKLLGK